MTDGFVYFAKAEFADGALVKVGYSNCPEVRVKEFFGRRLLVELIAKAPGRMCDEKALHQMLAKYAADRNEWFRHCRRLDRIISFVQANGTLPDVVTSAGTSWQHLADAKRTFNQSVQDAGNFFANRNRFGMEWA
jgi:hypothetical protein